MGTSSPRNIKAVLFDMDGTLLDTAEFIFQAFEHVLAKQELTVHDRHTMGKMMGRALSECYEKFAPDTDPEILMQQHKDFQSANRHLIKAFPQAPQLLEGLKYKGYKIAIVTSRMINARESLKLAKIDQFIDVLVDADSVTKHKPDPEPVLAALEMLKVKASKAVMVGDGDADIISARRAGTRSIGVTFGLTPPKILLSSKPDYVANSIEEIGDIIERLA